MTALAGSLRRPIYVINLSSPSMGDEALRALLNSASAHSILLLEVIFWVFDLFPLASCGDGATILLLEARILCRPPA